MSTFTQFKQHIDDGGSPKLFTYDLALIDDMGPEDRQQSVKLLEHLGVEGDLRAIESLGALPSPESVPALRVLATSVPGTPVADAAQRAINALTGEPESIAALVASMQAGGRGFGAILTASRLAECRDPSALPGLFAGLLHPSDIVRIHSWNGVEALLPSIAPLIQPRASPLWVLQLGCFTELDCVWASASRRLVDTLLALHRGTPPGELGLIYEPSPGIDLLPIKQCLWDEEVISPSTVAGLGPHDVAWLKASLLWRLGEYEEHAVASVAALGYTDLLPALKEALAEMPDFPEERAAYQAAINTLSAIRDEEEGKITS